MFKERGIRPGPQWLDLPNPTTSPGPLGSLGECEGTRIIPEQAWGRETEARGRASRTNSDNDKQASNSRLTCCQAPGMLVRPALLPSPFQKNGNRKTVQTLNLTGRGDPKEAGPQDQRTHFP